MFDTFDVFWCCVRISIQMEGRSYLKGLHTKTSDAFTGGSFRRDFFRCTFRSSLSSSSRHPGMDVKRREMASLRRAMVALCSGADFCWEKRNESERIRPIHLLFESMKLNDVCFGKCLNMSQPFCARTFVEFLYQFRVLLYFWCLPLVFHELWIVDLLMFFIPSFLHIPCNPSTSDALPIQARPQATWTLPLERLAASRPSDAKTQGDTSSTIWKIKSSQVSKVSSRYILNTYNLHAYIGVQWCSDWRVFGSCFNKHLGQKLFFKFATIWISEYR